MRTTWGQVHAGYHAGWITQQLDTLIDSLRLRLVSGDPVVLDLLEDLEDQVQDLADRWRQTVETHTEALSESWLLDENAPFAVFPETVPSVEMMGEDGGT